MAVDWRQMFARYADLVGEEEGIDFLNRGDWSEEERDEIDAALLEHGSDGVTWPHPEAAARRRRALEPPPDPELRPHPLDGAHRVDPTDPPEV